MKHLIGKLRSSKGTALLEYGLLAALIAIVVLVALGLLGAGVRDLFLMITSQPPL